MFYDELIKICIKALSSFDEKIETPDSFIDNYLKKVNTYFIYIYSQFTKDINEITFIKQVFFGVLRYKKFLKIFTDIMLDSKLSIKNKSNEILCHIIIYITIFRLDEIPLEDYKSILLVSFILFYFYI